MQLPQFYGTKRIAARPMTRAEYNEYRGWPLPSNENGDDAGYLVEYLDGGAGNHPDHVGYISWSPAAQFEAAYQPIKAMSFGHALVALKAGKKVARAGWNGKGMWLVLVPGTAHAVLREGTPYYNALLTHFPDDETLSVDINPHIDMMTATGQMQPGWLASQTDMLAEDWQEID